MTPFVKRRPVSFENDPVRVLIRRQLDGMGLSMNEASRRIGKNPTYLFHFIERGTPKVLPEDAREALASLLGLNPEALRTPTVAIRPALGNTLDSMPRLPLPGKPYGPGPVDLPVVTASTLSRGVVQQPTDQAELIARPDVLVGVDGAFAVRCPDGGMSPRYRQGDMLHFHPGISPSDGDGVCVTLRDGTRLIGIYQAAEDGCTIVSLAGPTPPRHVLQDDIVKLATEVFTRRRM